MIQLSTRNEKSLTINIVIFGIIGIVYYFMFVMDKLNESLFHPLAYGWFGIWFSIVGGLSILEFYKYRRVSLYNNAIYSIGYSILYFLGFFFIPTIVDADIVGDVHTIWLGILLVSYFITFGALNWYFGFYIALFNIIVAIITLTGGTGENISPIVWVDLFSLSGITNVYVQWGIVVLSAILGLLEKGFAMFDIFE